MATVQTSLGAIPADGLGMTLMHEHICTVNVEVQETYAGTDYAIFNEEAAIQKAVRELKEAKKRGIDTIVDLTVIGLGRNIPLIKKVAEQVDVNIVVATGIYNYFDVPSYFKNKSNSVLKSTEVDLMTEVFVRDIKVGIGATGVRAGAIKCCVDKAGVLPGVEKMLRASAQAQRETGVMLTTHTDGRHGEDQQRIFLEEGVDLSRTIIGHSGDRTNLEYLEGLLDKGSYLGMDRFGMDVVPFEKRVATVAALCARGWAERLVLSHDYVCFTDTFDATPLGWTNWNFNHIPDHVLPALLEAGCSEGQIRTMMVDNPRRLLTPQMN